MCSAISIQKIDLPDSLVEKYDLSARISQRSESATTEIVFSYQNKTTLLPARHENELGIYRWGNRDDKQSRLPKTGWCRQESLDAGRWGWLAPEPVEIPACFGCEKGVWYQITEGVRGVLVRDEQNVPHVYLLTQPASHYYEIMTRHKRMPVFIGQQM